MKMINDYITISDNKEANSFFQDMLDSFIWSLEDSLFLNSLRIWNRRNPDKKIKVLCTDIEHTYKRTIKHMLIPQLKSSEIVFKKDSLFSITYLKKIKSNIKNFESDEDNAELHRLIDNLLQTFMAYKSLKKKGYNSFNKIRQKAIVRKYERPLFFRSKIKKNKFIVLGGSLHMGTKNKRNLNTKSEGYYLEYINPYTRGLTYSIRLLCLTYKMDSTVNLEINPLHLPSNYAKTFHSYKKAWGKNIINLGDSVFIFNNYDSFTKQILQYSTLLDKPFSFASEDIPELYKPYYISFQDMKESEYYRNDYMKYDRIIIVPNSQLFHPRLF
jgi:hypothetical protein